ncbi:PAS domain-containing protein [Ferrovibrio sp.]|uniref:PAS domain-containing protein n=1 Tax=Ferrovibrio sp. TaxID=1917215 RepID=UPI0025BC35FC|nr:PAS domain-containing protein [Ferrovibrio sp.]MBX3456066.1 PAS domain-containing protein [Ferrovibrio sp.]
MVSAGFPSNRIDEAWPEVLPPRLAEFLAYWRSKCGPDGSPPFKSAIDPIEIPQLLAGVGIIQMHPQPGAAPRYRYRLLGTDHYTANGAEHTGLYLDTLHTQEEMARVKVLYAELLAGNQPHYWRRAAADPNLRHTGFSRILAPLRDADGRPGFLLGYWLWEHLRPY